MFRRTARALAATTAATAPLLLAALTGAAPTASAAPEATPGRTASRANAADTCTWSHTASCPPTELLGDGPTPIPLKGAATIQLTTWGYRYIAGQQNSHLTVTITPAGRIRFGDTGTGEWRGIPSGCDRTHPREGIAAVCDVVASKRFIQIWPRLGDDDVDAHTMPATFRIWMLADQGDDHLIGGRGDDFFNGAQDDDTAVGRAGADWLRGGRDADTLGGGDGEDYVVAQDGPDTASGGADADQVRGGTGADQLHGDLGDDRVLGEAGNDTEWGGVGADTITCQAGTDTAYVEEGTDSVPAWGACEHVLADPTVTPAP